MRAADAFEYHVEHGMGVAERLPGALQTGHDLGAFERGDQVIRKLPGLHTGTDVSRAEASDDNLCQAHLPGPHCFLSEAAETLVAAVAVRGRVDEGAAALDDRWRFHERL